jgi:predicted ribosome quality control (RQC) complex YloA/Tae2 family protein
VKLDERGEPSVYSSEAETGWMSFASFSEMADFYYANQKEESEGEASAKERMKKLQERLSSQEKTLERMGKEREAEKAAGDAIYAHFEKVEALLGEVRRMKKEGKGEDEINAALSASAEQMRGQMAQPSGSSKKAKLKGAEIELELG